MGVMWADACRMAGIPYVIHFHGVDACKILFNHGAAYKSAFCASFGHRWGLGNGHSVRDFRCAREKLVHGPYGVSVQVDRLAKPSEAPPLSCGRPLRAEEGTDEYLAGLCRGL